LENYINAKFSQLPELLGGNHSTTACLEVKEAHSLEDEEGNVSFYCPQGSKITPRTLPKFLFRYTHFVLSPVPLEDAKKSAYLRSALLTYARSLNDQSKFVKGATLTDNLNKARQGLEGFLRTQRDPKSNLYFKPKQSVWPQCHADLCNAVYSKPGIQTAVASVIAEEFISQKSAFKIAVNCPDDIFELMVQISQINHSPTPSKKNATPAKKNLSKSKAQDKPTNAVASARYFREFTLNYCTHADLKAALEEVRSALLTHGTKGGVFGKLTAKFQERTSFVRMLNAIAEDLSNNENPCRAFVSKFGPRNKEGFYEEDSFVKVICTLTFV
jgi:hypothetical protein